ncbi:ubiquitin-like-conjugating enzyme ATG10 isoform X2 [Lutra lutra]|uniref:ubiquitin-like-conjugating enzyme ATG10 isoform X2 n=1 Tax=Lutra lutra TaxID=9657 RepID=UPI001FD03D08|nr:ubiquitin-like-conjugating enzyme ATG10 isoform X2 [Lutra lutra]XP_047586963.1 ubiquitin-like-conjugating enzyme ATG10 isoform X2 [Lutra lutra]
MMVGNGELRRTVLKATCAKHNFKLNLGHLYYIREHLPTSRHVFPWRNVGKRMASATKPLVLRTKPEALELPPDDFEVTETTAGSEVVKYEYHVLYSCSYQVPVLYFRASFLDGRPLALKDIWEGIHECYKSRLLQEPWDTITQQEHPVLGQPFFVLHPCKTNEFMTPVLENSRKINRSVNYITSWLSVVGPVVGLNLPLSYARTASQDE